MADSLKDARILVTGAGGFIGRNLVRRLLQDTACVTSLDRNHSRPEDIGGEAGDQHDVICLDLRNAGEVKRMVEQVNPSIVFHLAAAGTTEPYLSIEEALRVNMDGTLNVLRAVRDRTPVVVARTPGEREALNVYAASKAAAWQFCRMFARTEDRPIVGAMIFQSYGPGQSLRNVLSAALQAACSGTDFPMSPGQQVRDWIHVCDVAEGLMATSKAALPAGTSVEIGSGHGTSLYQVVRRVFELSRAKGCPKPGALPYRPGEVMRSVADADRTAALTGWRACIALEDGLRELVMRI